MSAGPPPWRDHEDRPVRRPPPPGADEPPFYTRIGDLQGSSYRRNAFAQHTDHEADVLAGLLDLLPGGRVLDVGCGDGRHLRRLAGRRIVGVGVDASAGLVATGRAAAQEAGVAGLVHLVRGDARRLPVGAGVVDAAYSVHQGGFGTHPETDTAIIGGLARAVRPGGRIVLTAFHTLFAARHLAPGDAFDPLRSVHHQRTEVRAGDRREQVDLWTATYTARELRGVLSAVGLEVEEMRGVEPGRYDGRGLGMDDPEILVVARRVS